MRNGRDVSPRCCAQCGEVVDEGEFHCQERIRGVLDEFRALEPGDQDRCFDQIQWPVKLAQQFFRARAFHTDHHAVWAHEVGDCGAFSQELRVGNDVKSFFGTAAYDLSYLLGCSYRNRRLCHYDLVAVHGVADRFRHRKYRRDVRSAGVCRWRAHCDEDYRRIRDGVFQIRRESQALVAYIAFDQFGEPGFVDRDHSILEPGDLITVVIDANHFVSAFCEAASNHEADITRTNNREIHFYSRWRIAVSPTFV